MKVLNTLFTVATMMVAGTLFAQTDKEELEHARNAINVVKSCDDALRFLSNVSAEGKTTAAYFICMANAQDCKSNNEQALYYYNKYLELQPKNDSVRKRVAELADSKTQNARAANEERVAREVYANTAHTKKSKKKHNILSTYLGLGLTYSMPTNSADNPYKTGTGLSVGMGFPIADKKVVLDFAINSDFIYGKNVSWYTKTYNATAKDVDGASLGLSVDMEVSPMATIMNHRRLAWTAGPMIGLKYVNTSDPYIYSGGVENAAISGANVFGICYGAKTSLIVNDNGLFFVEYTAMPVSKFTTTNNPSGNNVNHNMLRLGMALRLDWY